MSNWAAFPPCTLTIGIMRRNTNPSMVYYIEINPFPHRWRIERTEEGWIFGPVAFVADTIR